MAVEARSLSPCTVVAREKAIADRARDSHSTASSALPRFVQAKACPASACETTGITLLLAPLWGRPPGLRPTPRSAFLNPPPAPSVFGMPLEIHIIENRKPAHMNLRRHRDRPQTADILVERPHLHADRARPPVPHLPHRRPAARRGWRRNLLIHEPAERQLVGQHERLRSDLDGPKTAAAQAENPRRNRSRIKILIHHQPHT